MLAARSQQGGGGEVEGELQAHVRRREHRGGGGKNRDRSISVGGRSRCGAQDRSTDEEQALNHPLEHLANRSHLKCSNNQPLSKISSTPVKLKMFENHV